MDEINLGNSLRQVQGPSRKMESLSPSGECEERKLEERSFDSGHRNNTDNQVGILQLLDTGQSSVGAQQQQIRGEDSEKRACIMESSLQQLFVRTARAVDRGAKVTPTAGVNNCFAVCRCDEVIKRCDSDQTATRSASCAEQCDSVQRIRLYPSLLARHPVAIITD